MAVYGGRFLFPKHLTNLLLCSSLFFSQSLSASDTLYAFTDADIQYLQQFSLTTLPPPPPDPSNQYADNLLAAKLGQQLFFDKGLSRNKKIACASCHQPLRYFTDSEPQGLGLARIERNTPSIIGASYGPWKYWDGRKDSLWAQALEPLEAPREHGIHRVTVAEHIRQHYSADYEDVFSELPREPDTDTRIFVNVGKALMAFQRQLRMPAAPIDDFIRALKQATDTTELQAILQPDQVAGLRLFVGKAACVSCHNGPLFTNFEFHNVGVPDANTDQVDLGRYTGIERLRTDEFNCLSQWSDAKPQQCLEMAFLKRQGQELVGAFKTPSLRNVAVTAPYMHAGQFASLETVVEHYNKPTPPVFNREQHPFRPHFDIRPLGLSEEEKQQLVAFLSALTSPYPEGDTWWQEP